MLHKLAAEHKLSPAAPKNVRHQFEIARHAYIYSGLYTPLSAAAEMYAVLAIEHALRIRYAADPSPSKRRPKGLSDLLEHAITHGWIRDEGFEFDQVACVLTDEGLNYQPIPEERRRRHTEIILEVLPAIRNSMAHGVPHMTLDHVSLHLQRATEIINQLFPAPNE